MGWAHRLKDCNDPADWGYCTCAVYSCGYSQPHRDWLTVERLEAGTAETDCSYGVGWWLYKGGYLDDNPAFSTATMLDYFRGLGWVIIDANAGFVALERNDVLLRQGHTALYIGDGMQAEATRQATRARRPATRTGARRWSGRSRSTGTGLSAGRARAHPCRCQRKEGR